MGEGKLVLIAGPSGAGKKTLIGHVIHDQRFNLCFSVSYTTRSPRAGEQEGVDYFYIDKEAFLKKIEGDEMLEYAHFFDNYYGTCKKWVRGQLEMGKNVLLEVETEGFKQIKEKFPEALSIFILPVSIKELEKRLKYRGTESDEDIEMRLKKAPSEIQMAHQFSYQIVNDELERAVGELRTILEKELN